MFQLLKSKRIEKRQAVSAPTTRDINTNIIGMTEDGRVVVRIPNGRATYNLDALVSRMGE